MMKTIMFRYDRLQDGMFEFCVLRVLVTLKSALVRSLVDLEVELSLWVPCRACL